MSLRRLLTPNLGVLAAALAFACVARHPRDGGRGNLHLWSPPGAAAGARPAPARIVAPARYLDCNGNGRCDAGDRIVVGFDRPLRLGSAGPELLVLPVEGDSLGEGAALVAGPRPEELTVVLGAGARLRSRHDFDPRRTASGAPSGIGLARDLAPEELATLDRALGALAGEPVDLAPGFVAVASFEDALPARALAAGDLDGDGLLDVVSAHDDGPVTVWLGGAQGGHVATQALGEAGCTSLALLDLDGDRALDLACGYDGRETVLWRNDGRGGFERQGELAAARVRALVAGDVDGDGKADLIAGGDGPNVIWLGDGRGGLRRAGELGALRTRQLLLADLDGDGDLDLLEATAAGEGAASHVWRNLGLARFVHLQELAAADRLALADLDGDGRLDAVLGARGGGYVHRGLSDALFGIGAQLDSAVGPFPVLGDVDGDGHVDLVQAREGELVVRAGDGSGRFGPAREALPCAWPRDLLLRDLDGDGDLDLLVANEHGIQRWDGSVVGPRASGSAAPAPGLAAR